MRGGRQRTRVGVAILALLLAATATGAVDAREDVVVNPSAILPVNLAAGATGTTTLGTSATSAATTHAGSITIAHEVLKVHRLTGSWDVRMSISSATGFGALDTATIKETLGATTLTQVVVGLGGTITQASGSPITLSSSATDLSITVVGTKLSAGSSVMTMTFTMTPTGATQPVLTYAYTLTLTL